MESNQHLLQYIKNIYEDDNLEETYKNLVYNTFPISQQS